MWSVRVDAAVRRYDDVGSWYSEWLPVVRHCSEVTYLVDMLWGDRRGTPKRRRWRPLKTPCTAQLTARGQSGLARRLPQHLTDLLGPVVGSTIRRSSEVGTLLSNRSRVTIGCAGGHGSKPTNIESTSSAAKVYL